NDCYVINEEGRWQWKGGVESMTSTIVNELSIYDTGDMPWLFPQAFYNRYDEAAVRRVNDELEKLTPFIQKPFPTYTLTKEQGAQIIPLQNVLGQYVDEAIAQFVLGQQELNEQTIAAFREGLTQNGMDEMVAFWQSVAQAD
ncbi:MAG: hypothetical protein RSH26_08565, partial [Clostridia bacterium]